MLKLCGLSHNGVRSLHYEFVLRDKGTPWTYGSNTNSSTDYVIWMDVVNSFTPPAAMPTHGTMGVRRAQLLPTDTIAAPGVREKHTPIDNNMRKENAVLIWKYASQCTKEMALAMLEQNSTACQITYGGLIAVKPQMWSY